MPFTLDHLRSFQDKRVQMAYDDGLKLEATFLSAAQDFDGSLHLVFDEITWANNPRELAMAKDAACYSEDESLIHIEELTNS